MMKKTSIRILIADDHYVVRMGLTTMINTEPDMEIVAEASDGAQAIGLFTKFNPDVTLLDLRMPVMAGNESSPPFARKTRTPEFSSSRP